MTDLGPALVLKIRLPLNIRLSLKLMHNKDGKVVLSANFRAKMVELGGPTPCKTFSSLLFISFNDSLILIDSLIFNGNTGAGPGPGPGHVLRFFGGFQLQDPGSGPSAF